MLPLMPLLWLVSPNFWYLLVAQMLSGLSWAGFTLGTNNFLYDLIEPQKRATYLALHNITASIGVFCGALLGGYLGIAFASDMWLFDASTAWISPLLGVFAVSAVMRTVVLLILLPKIKEVRRVRTVSFSRVIFRVTRINALAGVMFDVVGTRPKPPENAQ